MNISGVNYESLVDGVGMRTVIYVSGCSHNCRGCHNPQTHNPTYGSQLTDNVVDDIIREIQNRVFVTGITLSGGDPLYVSNREDVLNFIKKVKRSMVGIKSNFNVWLYTGYTFEELIVLRNRYKVIQELLENIDVLVDSKFDITKADKSLAFRGSSNQRIIDVKRSFESLSVVLYDKVFSF